MSFRNFLFTPAATAALVAAGLSVFPTHAGTEAGMRVARDPASGQLRAPTAAESKALDAKSTRAPVGMVTGTANPQPVLRADGSTALELDASTMVYTVARRAADGSIEMVCVNGSEAANLAVKTKKLAGKAAKEHQHDK